MEWSCTVFFVLPISTCPVGKRVAEAMAAHPKVSAYWLSFIIIRAFATETFAPVSIGVQKSAAFSIKKKQRLGVGCDIILHLMAFSVHFALDSNGRKILCAYIKWRIKQTSPLCLFLRLLFSSILFFLHNISWGNENNGNKFVQLKLEFFNENWNCAKRRERRSEDQNGSSSRDISYLIKADCVQLLIGLKLYDHDGGNWNKFVGLCERKNGICGDVPERLWHRRDEPCVNPVRSLKIIVLKEACIAK